MRGISSETIEMAASSGSNVGLSILSENSWKTGWKIWTGGAMVGGGGTGDGALALWKPGEAWDDLKWMLRQETHDGTSPSTAIPPRNPYSRKHALALHLPQAPWP